MTVPFRPGWYATDLGEYRPCQGTYELYSYDDQPPLDAKEFNGRFQWFGGALGPIDQDAVDTLERLNQVLVSHGLCLPADFVTFYSHTLLGGCLDEVSVTSCWTDLSPAPIASPAEPGAWLVQFLRDQQDCCMWYLYLRPDGETFVVVSNGDFQYLAECGRSEREEYDEANVEIFWCSPSFEQFAYRFWLENRIWESLEQGELDEVMMAYLGHYPSEACQPSPS